MARVHRRFTTRLVLASALLGWLWAAGTALADATVSGKVKDKNGTGLAGRTVSLMTYYGAPIATAVTAADGTWSCPSVPTGCYYPEVLTDGMILLYGNTVHFDEQKEINVGSTAVTGVDFTVPDRFAVNGLLSTSGGALPSVVKIDFTDDEGHLTSLTQNFTTGGGGNWSQMAPAGVYKARFTPFGPMITTDPPNFFRMPPQRMTFWTSSFRFAGSLRLTAK